MILCRRGLLITMLSPISAGACSRDLVSAATGESSLVSVVRRTYNAMVDETIFAHGAFSQSNLQSTFPEASVTLHQGQLARAEVFATVNSISLDGKSSQSDRAAISLAEFRLVREQVPADHITKVSMLLILRAPENSITLNALQSIFDGELKWSPLATMFYHPGSLTAGETIWEGKFGRNRVKFEVSALLFGDKTTSNLRLEGWL